MSDTCDTRFFERISDLRGEPHCWLLPIEGYEKLSVGTLENAIETLKPFVPDIERKVYIAKRICANPSDGLSIEESAAIMLYTMEWEPYDQCPFFLLNRCLREKNRASLRPWLAYLKLLLGGLDKLPTKTYRVFRGVKKDMHEIYKKGSIVVWWAFSSCTTNVEVLQTEHFLGKTGPRTMFSIECFSGKDIRKHSYYNQEGEILLLPARQFQVIGVLDQGHGLHTIQLQEIEPEVPLLGSTVTHTLQTRPMSSRERKREIVFFKYENLQLQDKIDRYAESKRINLTFQNLNDQDMMIVVTYAIVRKACRELDLSENQISSEGFAILARSLMQNTTLISLSVAANRITDEAIESLRNSLSEQNTTLNQLGLGTNIITDVGAQYLAEILEKNKTLKTLGLNNNNIQDDGVRQLMNALSHNNKTLQVLNLSFNKSITDESVVSIIDMLNENTTLTELYLARCGFSTPAKERLESVAQKKSNFKLYV